ncbi:MAG: cell surface protein SprA [bacterium]
MFLLLLLCSSPVLADPEYGDLVLPGFDPVLRATRDPRLLGVQRLLIRERMLAQGIDPQRSKASPDLHSLVQHRLIENSRVDLRRLVTVKEVSGTTGLVTVFQYPEYFYLFQTPEDLPGGFVYYPPRPVDAPEVELFLDDIDSARERGFALDQVQTRLSLLGAGGGTGRGGAGDGLLNLTIPIKLPRTLEKIIGRGEKTNIKITGREHIAIFGESTVSNRFIPNERVKSQSLFPTLEMEQQLQINLSGTIGEKIHIEVDHNSEVIGPEATKIRLMYQGLEDEIIQTIETGDVGLTLPGSQLLGYSSNKSGLFGIKVTGQVGRADWTVVASKQKAESAAKSFNSRGGEVADHTIQASNYVNNRFFRLDLPPPPSGQEPIRYGYLTPDAPGRPQGAQIDIASVKVFQFLGGGIAQLNDINYVAAYRDTTGLWGDYTVADTPVALGDRWREVDIAQPLRDESGNLIAIDLGRQYNTDDELAVIYDVVDANGELLYRVGDRPGRDEGQRIEAEGDGILYYRMKLLKPKWSKADAHTWQYVLRNIYSLGGANIDFDSFDLRIELNDQALDHPERDSNGLDWIRIFGLDRTDPQGDGGPDGIVDKEDQYVINLNAGLLIFPIDVPFPFNADREVYEFFADSDTFDWDASLLERNLIAAIYSHETPTADYNQHSRFSFVASHAAAASSFNLGVSNIEEDSETVTLDGRTLQRDVDYDIDYMFGQITLKGDAAAGLTGDSQVQVNYQYAPFFGGGKSSLVGFNMGYELGRDSRLSTTWLYESNQIVGHKAKLGEEPSRTLVGNVNLQHTFKPYFLTHAANFLSRHDSEKESTLRFNGELAISVPNPNTRDEAYLEDFEGIDASDILTLSRLSWWWASAPVPGEDPDYVADTGDTRLFTPEDRVPDIRWYIPKDRVQRWYLNPDLVERERQETQQALTVRMVADDPDTPEQETWQAESWGGIMRGLGRIGLNLTKTQFVEFWVNDGTPEMENRRGTLHFDFGFISEDFYWPENDQGELQIGDWQFEDASRDGIFTNVDEDTGLDGVFNGDDEYGAEYENGSNPYPRINGTELNNREDSEDLDGDTSFDRENGYFSISIDLKETAPLVDVVRDYSGDDVNELIDANIAWRKYRVRLGDILVIAPPSGVTPQISSITHARIWFEDAGPNPPTNRTLQLSEIKFLGSRWEREGIRKVGTEALLSAAERGPAETFFIGEVNNKDFPDSIYTSPFAVHEENRIKEKEQSLMIDFQELEHDHMLRVSKTVSPRGDDYTRYETLSWYWYNPDHRNADLDLFFRIGSDTTNYYEVLYRFAESDFEKYGWRGIWIDLAELSNVKNLTPNPETGWIEGEVRDSRGEVDDVYRVRVVGRPDLRRVKKYYFGVINETSQRVTGYVYANDVMLRGVKREPGLAARTAVRLNMADVIKIDADWSTQDAEFHGLNSSVGQGFTKEDWSLTTSMRLDDFVPLLGFQVPVNLSRSQTVKRPKYITNSDIELIDLDMRNQQSDIDSRESFSVRLNHQPSRAAIPRYLVDPWQFSLSGSRTKEDGPLQRSRGNTLQGSVTYDLRITGDYPLGNYGPLTYIPVLKGLEILPKKITFSGTFNSSERSAVALDLDGTVTPRPTTTTRRGNFNGSTEFKPLPILDISFNARSDRDLLRERMLFGVNIGQENQFGQDVRLTFKAPKATMFSDHWLLQPMKLASRAINALRSTVSFSGSFTNNHDPSIRQQGDAPNVSNISNSGDWEYRARLPINDLIEHIFPEKKATGQEREALLEQEQRRARESRGRGRRSPPREQPAETTDSEETGDEATGAGDATEEGEGEEDEPAGGEEEPPPTESFAEEDELTPEERRRLEEEALLEAARIREEEARREAGETTEEPETETEGEAAWDQSGDTGEKPKFKIPNPLNPLLNTLRNMSPIQLSLTNRNSRGYNRMVAASTFWYRLGLSSSLDVPDTSYISTNAQEREALTLSTDFKLTSNISVDMKYNQSRSSRTSIGQVTRTYQQDWPDGRLSLSGVEKWRIFGGGENGWFRNSSVDFVFKHGRSVNNYTDINFNPRVNTNFSPRWNFTFRNGMSATLNVGMTADVNTNNGTKTEGKRTNIGLQLSHSFQAERLLAKLNLYRAGSNPTIKMNIDIQYAKDTNQRFRSGAEFPDAITGTTRLTINPRFSYQISRNLSGALRLSFRRTKTLESDLVRKSFGLGLEATFVF